MTKKIFGLLAVLVLLLMFATPFLYALKLISEAAMKASLLTGTLLWFVAMLPHMRGRTGALSVLMAVGCVFSTSQTDAALETVESGEVGYVNANNGDSMWDVTYYESPEFAGITHEHFEQIVGQGLSGATRDRFSVQWSATVTVRRDGLYRFSLVSAKAASVSFDGEEKMTLAEAGQALLEVPLRGGVPVEMAVYLPAADSKSVISLRWEFLRETDGLMDAKAAAVTYLGPDAGAMIGEAKNLANEHFSAAVGANGAFVLTNKASGEQATFRPDFIVVARSASDDPGYQSRGARFADEGPIGNTNYFVPIWDKNPDYYAGAQPRWNLRPVAMTTEGNRVVWTFRETSGFTLEASLELPEIGGEPLLQYKLTPKAEAFFSVGFAGAPQVAMEAADWIWQPLVWTGRRFPNLSYLTPEYQCPIPFAMAGIDGAAIGVGADPKEMPFRMPVGQDSRFGVMVRNADGNAQPQVFAPILGGVESKRSPGQVFDFALRLHVGGDGWYENYRSLAQGLYEFGDPRENALGTLNETVDNMTEFFLHEDYSYWNPQHKSWGYQNDAGPEGIRQQSAAYAFSLALVLDSPEVLHERAIPTLEYMLTRNRSQAKSSDSNLLGGPNRVAMDYIPTHILLNRRNAALRQVSEETSPAIRSGSPHDIRNIRGPVTEGRLRLLNALAVYRLNGDERYLAMAKEAADHYIEIRIKTPAVDFVEAQSSFWTELAAAYDALYEIYEETGEKRYLDAAHAAIGEFTAYVYLAPLIPDEPFLANPGGEHRGVPIAEESVPAWRVSPNGLTAECAATAHSHRGIFMAPYAGYMLRIAGETGDGFLRDIARNSTVGRYMNYPTYAYRNGLTTIFEKPDYPLRSFEEIKRITSAHYNHPLPMTAFLVDYLVSDVFDRSHGKVTFPSEYANTGAYFRTKVYGGEPGQFFDDADPILWMPEKLIRSGSVQLNHISARGEDTFYVSFSNQSDQEVATWIQINPDLVDISGERLARAWVGDSAVDAISVVDGRAMVQVPAKGLVSLAIPEAQIRTRIQQAMLHPDAPQLTAARSETLNTELGKIRVTPLTYGKDLTTVHVLLADAPGAVASVTLRHSANGEDVTLTSSEHPHEFTVSVPDALQAFEFELVGGAVSSGVRKATLQ